MSVGMVGSGIARPFALEVYLLPATPWEEIQQLQQRLVYELQGERGRHALLLCEHPSIITVGRQGSREHILLEEEELRQREISVRWTNRGGGCWLQGPGQLAAYPIVVLDETAPALDAYRLALYRTLVGTIQRFGVQAEWDPAQPGVRVGGREIASVGIAVKNWVAYHGCLLNVQLPPQVLDWVRQNPNDANRSTCLFRESRQPNRMHAVREAFLENFVEQFGFEEHFLCHLPYASRSNRPRANLRSAAR